VKRSIYLKSKRIVQKIKIALNDLLLLWPLNFVWKCISEITVNSRGARFPNLLPPSQTILVLRN